MSCYFASPLRRMARNIRVSRARAQPVPALSLVQNFTYHRTLFP